MVTKKHIIWESSKNLNDCIEYFNKLYPNKTRELCKRAKVSRHTIDTMKHIGRVSQEVADRICNAMEQIEEEEWQKH